MLFSPSAAPSILLFVTVAATLLWWPRLPGRWRQFVAIACSAAGVLFLLVAMGSEGVRESSTTAVFLVGRSYVTERATAWASLPYYMLTGVCLLLGMAGLAGGDELARVLRGRWMASAVGLSLAVTALRFGLEKVAAPPVLTQAIGITWLAPIVGAWFALSGERGSLRALLSRLALYAFLVRGSVALLMTVASTLHLGSHYDISRLVQVSDPLTGRAHEFVPGTPAQILGLAVIPQLTFWPAYTVVAGLLGAAAVALLGATRGRARPAAVSAPVGMAAASEDGPTR